MTAATGEAAGSLDRDLTRTARSRWVESLAPPLVTALSVVLALRRLDNTDTWTILATGRWIVEHRSIPATDTLSYTVTDHRWINVQWLFDVVFSLLHQLGGPTLLIRLGAGLWSRRRRDDAEHPPLLRPLAATLTGLVVVIISQERFAIRPEMTSYLLIEVVLWLYAMAPATRGRLTPPMRAAQPRLRNDRLRRLGDEGEIAACDSSPASKRTVSNGTTCPRPPSPATARRWSARWRSRAATSTAS